MANLTKVLHVSKDVYNDVVHKVVEAIKQESHESKQMDRIISFFPVWSPEQIFIAGFTIGRLAETESQNRGQNVHYIFLKCDPDRKNEYADKPDK